MGLQLSPIGIASLAGSVIGIGGIAAYSAFESLNHALYYEEVIARVTAVEPLCAPDIDSSQYTGTMQWRPCGSLAEASWAELKQMKYERKVKLRFTFTSPADGRPHKGEFDVAGRTKSDNALKLFPGKEGLIWASSGSPNDYHYDAWPFASTMSS